MPCYAVLLFFVLGSHAGLPLCCFFCSGAAVLVCSVSANLQRFCSITFLRRHRSLTLQCCHQKPFWRYSTLLICAAAPVIICGARTKLCCSPMQSMLASSAVLWFLVLQACRFCSTSLQCSYHVGAVRFCGVQALRFSNYVSSADLRVILHDCVLFCVNSDV